MPEEPLILYRVGAVRDAVHVNARPGAVAVRGGRIVAAGELAAVEREAGRPDLTIDRPDLLILPGMVNAHAHLDLTHLCRSPYEGNFIGWIKGIMASRSVDEASIASTVLEGLRLSKESGVRMVADIAGSLAAVTARLNAPPAAAIAGVSFLEVLGFGEHGYEAAAKAKRQLNELRATRPAHVTGAIELAMQPHAPYSTGAEVYALANDGFPCASTHLAETPEEAWFIREAAGPFADLLKRLGKWDESIKPRGVSPVRFLRPVLEQGIGRWLVAHCNYVDDDDITTLARTRTSVAYCPVASDYFLHGQHRYREMIEAGVNVCLGTDSIVCQPADEPQPMSILAQMRHLFRRDGTDPELLLKMATVNGARAIQSDERRAILAPGEPADFLAVRFDPKDDADALAQVLRNREQVQSCQMSSGILG